MGEGSEGEWGIPGLVGSVVDEEDCTSAPAEDDECSCEFAWSAAAAVVRSWEAEVLAVPPVLQLRVFATRMEALVA